MRVWREPDFTGPVPVRPDGKITIPLVGDLQASGLTPERLTDQLKEALAQYITTPDITVQIVQVNSKKYYITGEVNHPGTFPLVVPVRIFEDSQQRWGFRDFANQKDIITVCAWAQADQVQSRRGSHQGQEARTKIFSSKMAILFLSG